MTSYLLDTHVWLWVQFGDVARTSPELISDLEQSQQEGTLFVSTISILEIARLAALHHYDLGQTVESFVADSRVEGGLQLIDMSPQILIESTRLPGELHRDPADRILAATARDGDLTLVTRDKALLQYGKQGHIKARKP